ncbi:heavy-metal-associated domain-containing protein [Mycobacterium sp. SMC-2]|uniref:heavy-metal-associated domain-containing protein n=1 Tax=Mycobacterium sp. SMC-2 TaxID=2857058 RepID=UPI0021B1A35D|nr:heavy metal-associated domain-containing protein [Mycobacterium sp. SMC-2]UXA07295.1 heavy-metal-associated domain-containing protein [Mycobacterium sp. SMC-2]
MNTSEFRVDGMSCGHCEAAVKEEVGRLPGVERVEVSADTGRLVITSCVPIDASAVLRAVEEAGYEAVLVA